MPFVRITVQSAALSETAACDLAAQFTRLMAETLGKRAELTSVLVERVQGQWLVGGAPAQAAAHAEALITAGTNSAEDKQRFIAQANALLRRELGSLPEATYVVLRHIPADDWGYDGRTQEARRVAKQDHP